VPPADERDEDLHIEGEPDAEDLAALYAMVTPSAHDDMKPKARPAAPAKAVPAKQVKAVRTARPAKAPTPAAAPAPAQSNVWKGLFLGVVGIAAAVAILFAANALVNGLPGSSPAPVAAAQPSAAAPAVDEAKIAGLMAQYEADSENEQVILTIADEFYMGGLYDQAAVWLDKLLAVNPEHIQGLLARGATYFNVSDLDNAETTWRKVLAIEPDNIEAHYDLGFLYLNGAEPDWAGVQEEWGRVVELDPGSDLAKTVQAHLDSLASSSMVPGASTDPAASTEPAASPAGSAEP
jgi:Flp pilus assembly protein TadD